MRRARPFSFTARDNAGRSCSLSARMRLQTAQAIFGGKPFNRKAQIEANRIRFKAERDSAHKSATTNARSGDTNKQLEQSKSEAIDSASYGNDRRGCHHGFYLLERGSRWLAQAGNMGRR